MGAERILTAERRGTRPEEARPRQWAYKPEMAKEAEMKVITYQAPNWETIDLSQAQVAMLERAQKWPRNSRGEEYCSVSHGLHEGIPTYSDAELRAEVGITDEEEGRAVAIKDQQTGAWYSPEE